MAPRGWWGGVLLGHLSWTLSTTPRPSHSQFHSSEVSSRALWEAREAPYFLDSVHSCPKKWSGGTLQPG